MTVSRVEDIANMALDYIGESNISNIDDPENLASVKCKQYFDKARRDVFEEVNWVFNTSEKSLVPVSLPSDKFKLKLSDSDAFLFPMSESEFNHLSPIYTREYPFVFALPPMFIRAIKVFNNFTELNVANQSWTKRYIPELGDTFIVSKYPELKMLYVYDVSDVTRWPSELCTAVALNLAFYISTPIKRDKELSTRLYSMYSEFLKKSILKDLNENCENEPLWENEFTGSRNNWSK